MVPKIALVTDDGLISVFNRSLAGATGICRGPACRGPEFGWTSPDREIKSQSQRCERIDLNLGGSLILGYIVIIAQSTPVRQPNLATSPTHTNINTHSQESRLFLRPTYANGPAGVEQLFFSLLSSANDQQHSPSSHTGRVSRCGAKVLSLAALTAAMPYSVVSTIGNWTASSGYRTQPRVSSTASDSVSMSHLLFAHYTGYRSGCESSSRYAHTCSKPYMA